MQMDVFGSRLSVTIAKEIDLDRMHCQILWSEKCKEFMAKKESNVCIRNMNASGKRHLIVQI